MFLDVFDEYETGYLLCCEHIETCSPDGWKACSEVPEGTVEYGIKYEANKNINLEGYVDSYWEGSAIDRKSTLRCYFSMISNITISGIWCREALVNLRYVAMEEQIADVLMKPLARVKFEYFRENLGVLQIEVPSKGK